MAVHGQRKTSDVTSQIIKDVAAEIYNVENGYDNKQGPLAVLLNNLPGTRRTVKNFKFECFEEAIRVRGGTVPGGALYDATSITFDTTFGAQMEKGMVVYVPSTSERIYFTDVNNATYTATVIRNFGSAITGDGGTTNEGDGKAISATAEIKLAGQSKPQGSTAPEAVSTTPEASYNYTQIFEHTTNMAGTLEQVALYGETNTLEHRTKAMLIFHKICINNAFWYGARRTGTDPATGKPIYHTGGIFQHLKANNSLVSDGVITMKVLDAFAETVFENGSDIKYLFGGMRFASCLDNLGRNVVRVDNKVESFGTNMKEIVTNKGTFRFVLDNKVFEGEMGRFVPCLDLDSKTVQYALLQNRDTELHTHVEDKKDDESVNLARSEVGLYMHGYGLDHSLAASTGSQRAVHGLLYTNQTAFDY